MIKETGGPAFPRALGSYQIGSHEVIYAEEQSGMSLRQYAAIKLLVPDSGTDWLDAMIKEAKRDSLAGMALQGLCGNASTSGSFKDFAKDAYKQADAMLAEREKG